MSSMSSNKRLRIGILFGGRSGEHEVSLASAASVIRALDPEKYEAVPIGISKDGRWLVGTKAHTMLPEVLKSGDRVSLPPDPTAGTLIPMAQGSGRPSINVDVMFPVLHGTFGEDGTVQGLLELAGLPYVGAGVLASAVGMDKDVQKRLFEQAGLPIVPFLAIRRSEWEREREVVLRQIKKKFRFPIFIKPATLGSSVGMSRVKAANELPAAMDLAAEFALKIIVERGVTAREIEVSVLGNDDVQRFHPRRNRAASRVLRLRREIPRRGHAAGYPRGSHQKTGAHFSGICRARFPRYRRNGNVALRLFLRTQNEQDFRE